MTQATAQIRWTIHALEVLPQSEGTRYEIIDGERQALVTGPAPTPE
jgi:hypothetical protein